MDWWRFVRAGVAWALTGLAVNCSVDDQRYQVDPGMQNGEGGEGADSTVAGRGGSAASGGAKAVGGQPGQAKGGSQSGGSGGGATASGGSVAQGASPSAVTGGTATAGGSNGGGPSATGGTGEPTTPSGGSSTAPEDCDCDDPSCAGRVCVPAAPADWSGPILLFEGAAAWLPECMGELGDESFNGGTLAVQEDLRCTGCGCGELTDGKCSLPYVAYADSSCEDQDTSGTLTTACNAPPQAPAFKFGSLEFTANCTPQGGEETSRADPLWEKVVRGCGLSDPRSAGCEDGSICMPEPSSPFEDTACIHRTGQHACPSDYPTKHSYMTSLKDERSCGSCRCVPSGNCSAILTAYDNQSCNTGGSNMTEIANTIPDTCHGLDTTISVAAMRLTSVNVPGNCSPVPPPPSERGSIRAEGPFTVCCQ